MPSFSFDTYLKSIQKNLQQGSERSHYPALKALLDAPADEIDAVIEEKGNKAGIPDFTVKRRELLVGYVEAKDVGLDLDQIRWCIFMRRFWRRIMRLCEKVEAFITRRNLSCHLWCDRWMRFSKTALICRWV